MEYVVYWITIGVSIGFLVRNVFPREQLGGYAVDLVVGMIGGIAGGWSVSILLGAFDSAWIASFTGALLGACVLLYVLRLAHGRSRAG